MARRMPIFMSATLAATVGLFALTTVLTAQPAKPAAPATGPTDGSGVKRTQEENLKLFKKFADDALRLAQKWEKSDSPEDKERAKSLRAALKLIEEQGVEKMFKELIEGLNQKNLNGTEIGKLIGTDKKLIEALDKILAVLESENESEAMKLKIKELEKQIEAIKALQRDQENLRGKTENPRSDAEKIAKEQKDLAKRTDAVAKAIDQKNQDGKNDGNPNGGGKEDPKSENKSEAKPGDNAGDNKPDTKENKSDSKGDGKGSPMGGDPKAGDPKAGGDPKMGNPTGGDPKNNGDKPSNPMGGDPKMGDPKAGDPKGGPQDPKAGDPMGGKPSDGKPSDSKSQGAGKGDSKPSDGKGGEGKPMGGDGMGGMGMGQPSAGSPKGGGSPSGGQPSKPKDPAAQNVQDAVPQQQGAEDDLKKDKRDDASKKQDKAIEELQKAIAELEKRLKQLREKELAKLLANLEERVGRMLKMQIEVRDATVAIDKTVQSLGGKPGNPEIQKSQAESDKESTIVAEAEKALKLMEGESTAVVFAGILSQVKGDMVAVQNRLNATRVGSDTVQIENDIIDQLTMMKEALKKAKQDLENKPSDSKPGDPQPPGKPRLLELLNELKLLRAQQDQLNKRTIMYNKKDPVEQANDPIVQTELKQLSERQKFLQEMLHKIATQANQ